MMSPQSRLSEGGMNARIATAALIAASALALTTCSSSSDSDTKSAPSPSTPAAFRYLAWSEASSGV